MAFENGSTCSLWDTIEMPVDVSMQPADGYTTSSSGGSTITDSAHKFLGNLVLGAYSDETTVSVNYGTIYVEYEIEFWHPCNVVGALTLAQNKLAAPDGPAPQITLPSGFEWVWVEEPGYRAWEVRKIVTSEDPAEGVSATAAESEKHSP